MDHLEPSGSHAATTPILVEEKVLEASKASRRSRSPRGPSSKGRAPTMGAILVGPRVMQLFNTLIETTVPKAVAMLSYYKEELAGHKVKSPRNL